MSQVRKTPYTSVSLTPEAVDALRRLAVDISAAVKRRVSMSEAILTLDKLAFRHELSFEECAVEAGVTKAP